MMKIVLKLDFVDDKIKQKAMRKVCVSGLASIVLDPKDKKLTVIGDFDPVDVVTKLRKLCRTELISAGPEKEPEKKKEEPKKEDDKKKVDQAQLMKANQAYYYQNHHQYYRQPPYYYYPYHYRTVEEDPNGCVIC